MLDFDALNMDMHGSSIQFRYKPLIILSRPHAKLREKLLASPSIIVKKKLLASCRGRKKNSSGGWAGKKTHREFSARGHPRSLMVRPLFFFCIVII